MLLAALEEEQAHDFTHIVTGDEIWFDYNSESSQMFPHMQSDVVPRVAQTICSKKAIIPIFFAGTRVLVLASLPHG
jgi:hypothetical protein